MFRNKLDHECSSLTDGLIHPWLHSLRGWVEEVMETEDVGLGSSEWVLGCYILSPALSFPPSVSQLPITQLSCFSNPHREMNLAQPHLPPVCPASHWTQTQ